MGEETNGSRQRLRLHAATFVVPRRHTRAEYSDQTPASRLEAGNAGVSALVLSSSSGSADQPSDRYLVRPDW